MPPRRALRRQGRGPRPGTRARGSWAFRRRALHWDALGGRGTAAREVGGAGAPAETGRRAARPPGAATRRPRRRGFGRGRRAGGSGDAPSPAPEVWRREARRGRRGPSQVQPEALAGHRGSVPGPAPGRCGGAGRDKRPPKGPAGGLGVEGRRAPGRAEVCTGGRRDGAVRRADLGPFGLRDGAGVESRSGGRVRGRADVPGLGRGRRGGRGTAHGGRSHGGVRAGPRGDGADLQGIAHGPLVEGGRHRPQVRVVRLHAAVGGPWALPLRVATSACDTERVQGTSRRGTATEATRAAPMSVLFRNGGGGAVTKAGSVPCGTTGAQCHAVVCW